MDVIGFLCVSLGSSTVQLHDSLGIRRACSCSEVGFSSYMTTVLECTNEEGSVLLSFFFFCGQKDSAMDIHKEIFLVYSGKCLSHRAVHNWLANVSLTKRLTPSAEVAETTVKTLLCRGVWRTGKALRQVLSMLMEKYIFFTGSNITCFTFYIYLLLIYQFHDLTQEFPRRIEYAHMLRDLSGPNKIVSDGAEYAIFRTCTLIKERQSCCYFYYYYYYHYHQ
jgi:hypothetical protein